MATITIKDIEKVVQVDGKATVQSISRLTAPGENYLSVVYKVDFLVEKDGKSSTLSTVLKRIPPNSKENDDFNAVAMENEIKVYKTLIPLLQKYGKEYGLAVDFFPEYLGSRLSLEGDKIDEEAALLLKNLIPEGYKNEDRTVGFDLSMAKAALSTVAKLHAIPLLLKIKNPTGHQEILDALEAFERMKPPVAPEDGSGPPNGFLPPDTLLIKKLLTLPEFSKYHTVLEYLEKNAKPMPEMFNPKGVEPWNTLSHNDFWGNNMMVNMDGTPPVVLLDFQVVGYSSYARDLTFFILTTAQDNVLKNNIDELLRHYYDEFTSIFEKWNVPELKLTYEAFLEEVTRVVRDTEFQRALFFCMILNVDKTGIADFQFEGTNMMNHLTNMINSLNERQKAKFKLIFDIALSRNWIQINK